MKVVGIYSPVPQCGKSSVAQYLAVYDFKVVSFARPLKLMVRLLLSNLGYPPELVNRFMNEAKEEPVPNLGVSTRHLCQTLGTEWGRDCVHPELWNRCWRVAVERHTRNGHNVVCDDVRFPNEAEFIQATGGQLWRLVRSDAPVPATSHSSDGALETFSFDHILTNDSTLLDLYSQIDKILCPDGQLLSA